MEVAAISITFKSFSKNKVERTEGGRESEFTASSDGHKLEILDLGNGSYTFDHNGSFYRIQFRN